MDQPTDGEQAAESGTQAIPQQAGQPSPVQLARSTYIAHATTCPKCKDVDRERCADGQQLWRDWESVCNEAYRQLAEQSP